MIFSAHVGDKEEIFMEKKCDWIITILDSGAETATIKRFNGTKNEAKKLLFQLSKEDSEGEEIYDIAETVDDVDEISDAELFTETVFVDRHFDYTAIKLAAIDSIALRRKK